MKFKIKISLFLVAMFVNCTANAASDDEADINADQNQIQPKADSNNNAISGKRKKFKTNKKLVRAQNKATKRTMDYLCDLLANINVGASCEERKFKIGNH